MVFVNERVFKYSTQLNETLEIQATDLTNGSKVGGNITIFAMYSVSATGTSLNSTAISIPGTEHFTTVTTLHPIFKCYSWVKIYVEDSVPALTPSCSHSDTCPCVTGWNGSQCDEGMCSFCLLLCSCTALPHRKKTLLGRKLKCVNCCTVWNIYTVY